MIDFKKNHVYVGKTDRARNGLGWIVLTAISLRQRFMLW